MITAEQAANKIPDGAAEVHVFKSRIPNINYILKNGKVCPFIQGRYLTNVPAEISEITAEIHLGHPHMYIDKNELTFDLSNTNALAGLRDRFMAEFLAMTPAEREALKRIDPSNPTGALIEPTLVDTIAQDPTIGSVGNSNSDQNFRIKVASSADAPGGANNPVRGGPAGFISAKTSSPSVPPSTKSTLADLRATMDLTKSDTKIPEDSTDKN